MNALLQRCMDVFRKGSQHFGRTNSKPAQRKYRRFPIGIDADYSFNGNKNGRCKICDISAEGMALKLYTDGKIAGCERLDVFIHLPEKKEKVPVDLSVKWIAELENRDSFTYMAGGVCTFSDNAARKNLLEYAYTNWFRGVA